MTRNQMRWNRRAFIDVYLQSGESLRNIKTLVRLNERMAYGRELNLFK